MESASLAPMPDLSEKVVLITGGGAESDAD